MIRMHHYVGICLSVSVLLMVASPAVAADKLKPVDVRQFFVAPETPAMLAWRTESDKLKSRPLKYTIRDCAERSVRSGTTSSNEQGVISLEVTLPRGYYDIEFPEARQRFGIVALPAVDGKPDPFFSIDGALSWLVRNEPVREQLVEVLQRCGIAMVRERLNWGEIQPAESEWRWNGNANAHGYDTLRQQLIQHGVPALEVFHNAPRWTGLVEKYPDDLVATARSWVAISRHWRRAWGALEVWNEPDIFFGGNLPADQYVAVVKAIVWGYDRAEVKVPIVGGVFAHHDRDYLDCAARNGMLDLVDVASFHTYGKAEQMEELVQQFRAWVERHAHRGKPLWLTECGRPWKRGPDRPPATQDAVSALDITMKAIEARACGIERYFAFVYPFYEERDWNFGMMGREATPLRSMAAYVQCAARLGHKRYLGDLKRADKSIRRARVFGDARETVLVLYTGRIDGDAAVRLELPVARAEGIDGRPLAIDAAGRVPIPDGLTYVWVERDAIQAKLRTETTAMALSNAAAVAPRPRTLAASIVLRYQYQSELLEPKSQGYLVKGEPAKGTIFTARVFNLAEDPRDLAVELTCATGNDAVDGARRRQLRVPASAHMDVRWVIDLPKALAKSGRATWTVTANSPTAGRILPLVVDVKGEVSLPQVLESFQDHERLTIDDSTKWKANITGRGRMKMRRAKDGAWRWEAVFGKGDRWCYPVLTLAKDIDMTEWNGIVIRARSGNRGSIRVIVWEGDSGVGYLSRPLAIAPDGKWHTVVVPFASLAPSGANAPDPNGKLDLNEVRRLSIGMNTQASEAWLEIRDLYLIGKAK